MVVYNDWAVVDNNDGGDTEGDGYVTMTTYMTSVDVVASTVSITRTPPVTTSDTSTRT